MLRGSISKVFKLRVTGTGAALSCYPTMCKSFDIQLEWSNCTSFTV